MQLICYNNHSASAFFQKGWKAGACKIHASRAASVTDFAGDRGARLNGYLAARARSALFMRAAAQDKGSALGEGQNPQGALSFPFTRRLPQKAGENF